MMDDVSWLLVGKWFRCALNLYELEGDEVAGSVTAGFMAVILGEPVKSSNPTKP